MQYNTEATKCAVQANRQVQCYEVFQFIKQ